MAGPYFGQSGRGLDVCDVDVPSDLFWRDFTRPGGARAAFQIYGAGAVRRHNCAVGLRTGQPQESLAGLPTETALGFALVATVMLVEWAIHAYKRPLERFFQLNDDPDVRRIQQLSERLLTTSDLHQFLESILAATCEALRTPTAFVAAITADGPKLEAVVGPLTEPDAIWGEADWQDLAQGENGNGAAQLQEVGNFIVWQNYWIRPLHNRQDDVVLGIFGIRARSTDLDLTNNEQAIFEKLIFQAAGALEDRILQQEVFRL